MPLFTAADAVNMMGMQLPDDNKALICFSALPSFALCSVLQCMDKDKGGVITVSTVISPKGSLRQQHFVQGGPVVS